MQQPECGPFFCLYIYIYMDPFPLLILVSRKERSSVKVASYLVGGPTELRHCSLCSKRKGL